MSEGMPVDERTSPRVVGDVLENKPVSCLLYTAVDHRRTPVSILHLNVGETAWRGTIFIRSLTLAETNTIDAFVIVLLRHEKLGSRDERCTDERQTRRKDLLGSDIRVLRREHSRP